MRIAIILMMIITTTAHAAPSGWVAYCADNPCNIEAGTIPANHEGRITLDERLRNQIAMVHRRVNNSIRTHIKPGPDKWMVGASAGDCDDYAMTKRHALISLGFPSSSVVLALGFSPNGVYHIVTVIRTTDGDLYLDNLHKGVKASPTIQVDALQSWAGPHFWSEAPWPQHHALNSSLTR